MKPKSNLRHFLAAIGASIIAVSSASAQSTYTWANSNTEGVPPATALDWFTGGSNTQGGWVGGNAPVSGNTNTIQIFADNTTALTGWTGTLTQQIVVNSLTPIELGTLTLSGRGNITTNNILTLNTEGAALNFSAATGTINLDGTQPATNRRIEHKFSNEIRLGTASSGTVLTITGAGTNTFQLLGGINELQAGGGSVVKSGTSTLFLGGTSNFSGGLTLAGGTVQLTSTTDSLGAADAAITVTASSTLNFGGGGTHTIAKSLLVNGGTTFTTVKSAAGTSTITGIVSGNGTVSVNNAGSVDQRPLIFSNASNTFTGTVDLTLTRSTLRVASIGDATGAGNILLGRTSENGFYLDPNAVAAVALNHRQIEIASGGAASGFVNIYNSNTTSTNTLSINTALLVNSSGGTKDIRLGGSNSGANTLAGVIANGADYLDVDNVTQPGTAISIRKQGAGNWALANAANTFTGAITLDNITTSAGTLAYASAGGANPITFNQTNGTATLSYTGSATQTMSGPITASALTTGTITLDSSGLGSVNYSNPSSLGSAASGIRNLVLSGSSTGNNILAGQWADNTGAAATVTKNGAGKWVLAGSNSFTGATTINGGTLAITGATQATTAITFTAGSLGLDTGVSVTAASAAVDLTSGAIKVTGATGAASYTLLTAASIDGEPVLAEAVSGYELQIVDGATDELRLVKTGAVSAYDTWSGGAAFDADANGDGVSNGLAFLLGATGPNLSALDKLPVATQTGGNLKLTFDMLPPAARGSAQLFVEHSADLGTWSTGVLAPDASGGTAPVTFIVTDSDLVDPENPLDVEVTISASEAAGNKLFGRLKAVNP